MPSAPGGGLELGEGGLVVAAPGRDQVRVGVLVRLARAIEVAQQAPDIRATGHLADHRSVVRLGCSPGGAGWAAGSAMSASRCRADMARCTWTAVPTGRRPVAFFSRASWLRLLPTRFTAAVASAISASTRRDGERRRAVAVDDGVGVAPAALRAASATNLATETPRPGREAASRMVRCSASVSRISTRCRAGRGSRRRRHGPAMGTSRGSTALGRNILSRPRRGGARTRRAERNAGDTSSSLPLSRTTIGRTAGRHLTRPELGDPDLSRRSAAGRAGVDVHGAGRSMLLVPNVCTMRLVVSPGLHSGAGQCPRAFGVRWIRGIRRTPRRRPHPSRPHGSATGPVLAPASRPRSTALTRLGSPNRPVTRLVSGPVTSPDAGLSRWVSIAGWSTGRAMPGFGRRCCWNGARSRTEVGPVGSSWSVARSRTVGRWSCG
jgi:hypothetical protein